MRMPRKTTTRLTKGKSRKPGQATIILIIWPTLAVPGPISAPFTVVDNGIEDSGDTRYNHGLGKRFHVARFGDEKSDQAWQFDLEIGYFASFRCQGAYR